MRRVLLVLICLLAYQESTLGQDISFNQVHSVPLYFNPAFAGSLDQGRLSVNHRNQWPGPETHPTHYYVSYDQPVDILKGGLGLLYYNTRNWPRDYNYAGIAYSAKLHPLHNLQISPAIKFGIGNVQGNGVVSDATYWDLSLGFLVNTKNFFVGWSADHLNAPVIEDMGDTILNIAPKYMLQTGYKFDSRGSESRFSLSPGLLLQLQEDEIRVLANISFRYKSLLWGIGYNEEDVMFLLGYQFKLGNDQKLTLGYSIEPDPTPLKENIDGIHEISLRYFFNPPLHQTMFSR